MLLRKKKITSNRLFLFPRKLSNAMESFANKNKWKGTQSLQNKMDLLNLYKKHFPSF